MLARTAIFLIATLVFITSASAQDRGRSAKAVKDGVSCNEFAQPLKQLFGQPVGVEQCLITSEETVFNIRGQKFRRMEIRLSGGVEGWASREKGSRAIYFSDGPDFVLTQSGLTGPRAHGVGKYEKCANCMVHCGFEGTAATDAIKHPLKMLPILLRGVKTEGPMAPEIDLSKQRPAEFTFSRHVEHKMSEIKAGNSNTTEIEAAE